MKGLTARWSFRQPSPATQEAARSRPLVDRILAARGFDSPELAGAFIDPKLTHLHDPSLMPDMDRAAARLLEACRAGEPIVIYGDYDVDGITATAILYHTLRAIAPTDTPPITTYVPHRLEEGYGLNSDAIRELASAGAKVIVSVDCGITAVEPALVAMDAGVDLIITDHHHPPERISDLPAAFAVVHPRRPDSTYPFGELSGAGVAYKLAWRLATLHAGSHKVAPALRTLLVELLAFAAIGTIADIVPLVGENRVIARFGLVRARHSPFIGLRALVDAAGLTDEKLGEMEVGFRLGPRLNAAGRMGHAKDAVELFTTADDKRSRAIAKVLSSQNDERRKVEQAILELACELAEGSGMTDPGRRAIVLAHESWHAGVIGIVCSRLVERYHRPTILMQRRDGHCHGSARSVSGFDLHAGLVHCAEHLDRFGGHTMAAGLHLAEIKLSAFTDAFTAYANERLEPDHLCAHLGIDCEADGRELTPDNVAAIDALAPFGASNPQVNLLLRNVRLAARPEPLGSQGKHLALQLALNGPSSPILRSVAWNWGEHAPKLAAGMHVDAVVTPKISTWNGRSRVEPVVHDLAIAK